MTQPSHHLVQCNLASEKEGEREKKELACCCAVGYQIINGGKWLMQWLESQKEIRAENLRKAGRNHHHRIVPVEKCRFNTRLCECIIQYSRDDDAHLKCGLETTKESPEVN